MSRQVRSRRMGLSAEEARLRPLYARALGLRYLNPGGMLCFVYFEGTLALGVLLALAELVSWWAVLILPGSVAVMVKINDLVAGAVARSAARTAHTGAAHAPRGETAHAPRGETAHAPRGETAHAPRGETARPAYTGAARSTRPETLHDQTTGAVAYGEVASGGPTPDAAEQVEPTRESGCDQRAGRWNVAVGRAAVVTRPAETDRRLPAYPLNVHPAEQVDSQGVRHWADRMDHADGPTQRARQSASRRYE